MQSMPESLLNRKSSHPASPAMLAWRVALMLLPACLILIAILRQWEKAKPILWVCALTQLLACGACLLNRRNYRQPVNAVMMILYLTALSCLLITSSSTDDWFPHLAQALLLMVPLLFFGFTIVSGSGAPALRHARGLARRLAHRKDWPGDLQACRELPEVKALREALQIDAGPALELLENPRDEVRLAALAALEFRKDWRPGQAETVLEMAQSAKEPIVRAAALAALGNVDSIGLIESMGDFLRDPAPQVRKAAREALLWNLDQRWRWLHQPIRRALGDPVCFDDGPLKLNGQLMPPEAVNDYMAWIAEGGIVGHRAAQTLSMHYAQVLSDSPKKSDINIVHFLVADSHTSPLLRLELAKLLQEYGELDLNLLERVLDSSNPAPLRLFGVKALLAQGPHEEALVALKELARLPNREIALATAEVVQSKLGIDLGLPLGQLHPPLHSRQAADIARRVMAWASVVESDNPQALRNPALTRGTGQ
jgi:hypothetical protein